MLSVEDQSLDFLILKYFLKAILLEFKEYLAQFEGCALIYHNTVIPVSWAALQRKVTVNVSQIKAESSSKRQLSLNRDICQHVKSTSTWMTRKLRWSCGKLQFTGSCAEVRWKVEKWWSKVYGHTRTHVVVHLPEPGGLNIQRVCPDLLAEPLWSLLCLNRVILVLYYICHHPFSEMLIDLL